MKTIIEGGKITKGKAVFNPKVGYPIYIHTKRGYFKESLYCNNCEKCVEFREYFMSGGLIIKKGFFCKKCSRELTKTLIKKITEEECSYENKIMKTAFEYENRLKEMVLLDEKKRNLISMKRVIRECKQI